MALVSNNTQQEYIKRINEVLDFIEQNLEADLSLKALSAQAHYSPFHFHRLFNTVMAENLNELVTRKRMERIASILLVGTQEPIKDLAYSYGFNSESSFSRAFKKHYGMSPTAFKATNNRQLSKIGIVPLSTEKYFRSLHQLNKWLDMNVEIVVKEIEAMPLACIAKVGDFQALKNMFERLMEWGARKNLLNMDGFKAITIYHDNPNVTETSKQRFSACVTVNQPFKADGEIRPLEIPSGIYAIGSFEILGQDFPKAWSCMNTWVLERGYEFRDGFYFEYYNNDHTNHPEQKFLVDIYIPLESSKSHNQVSEVAKENLCFEKEQVLASEQQLDHYQLIIRMKELQLFFQKAYEADFTFGNVYQGNKNFSYFSLTSHDLKKVKLKFVIILDHVGLRFRICLSGQNKAVRKKYWKLFKNSDWDRFPLVATIENSLSIMDHTLLEQPNFSEMETVYKLIEQEALMFINELRAVLKG